MKLLRTIRLDPSDSFVFERAATAGEWAIPGTFEFWSDDVTALAGRRKQAFRAGFLGLESFGFSTLVVAVDATTEDFNAAVGQLAKHLSEAHGAPDVASARAAAEEEMNSASALAAHPSGTLIAMHRTVDKAGDIREQFRTLRPADAKEAAAMPCSAGAFAMVEDDSDQADAGEDVSLVNLAGTAGGSAR